MRRSRVIVFLGLAALLLAALFVHDRREAARLCVAFDPPDFATRIALGAERVPERPGRLHFGPGTKVGSVAPAEGPAPWREELLADAKVERGRTSIANFPVDLGEPACLELMDLTVVPPAGEPERIVTLRWSRASGPGRVVAFHVPLDLRGEASPRVTPIEESFAGTLLGTPRHRLTIAFEE